MRIEPDGSMVAHADMSAARVDDFNELVVDGRGNIYVNGGCDFHPGAGNAPGSSLWSPRTDRYAWSPTGSRSPTAWP